MKTPALLMLACLAVPALSQAQDESVPKWVAAHAIPLTTPEAGHGFADMQALKKVVGDARIVSLGEATHGSREFFQLKHRMLEFLVNEMGFTIFSIEANMPEAYRLNEYVLTGKGDPAQLLRGMYFWTWDTEEVLAMIQWMRDVNKSGKAHVEFTGFDMQTPDVAMQIVNDYAAQNALDAVAAVRAASEQVNASAPRQGAGAAFGVVNGTFPIKEAAGKRVKFSGWIKTEGVTRGYAGLWWRVDGNADGKRTVLAFDNMQNRGPKGTTDWKRYEIELPVAKEATNINFGAILTGNGTAWVDGLEIALDGKLYNDPSVFDLDFESDKPVGFRTAGEGYRMELDPDVFHSGKQSMRMKFLSAAPAPMQSNAASAKSAVSSWKDVIRQLETSAGAKPDRDAAWAIQNARVVLQCVEQRANEVTRDRSMADNIAWIMDQSPNAKVVLWAHNGHVSTETRQSYVPMGASLRKTYGEKMVVFGFGFNQGSFQSVDMGRGLRNFTVGPAPDGSLDATLAASKVPLFALDLRQIPKSGPIADWFNQPHAARSIGSVFSDDNANSYLMNLNAPAAFDVMLFVEKTSAARKNPK